MEHTSPGDYSVPAKIILTAFLLLVGVGYLVALFNIYEHHQDADLEPGLTIDDLRRAYHGLEKNVSGEPQAALPSPMLRMVSPGGKMRKNLEKGGEQDVRVLISWLEEGGGREKFASPGAYGAGTPSPRQVIARNCIRCHNADGGDAEDVPYAPDPDTLPDYELVSVKSRPPVTSEAGTVYLAPMDRAELVQITHAHMLAIPVFVLIVGWLFLQTGLPERVKILLGPLPMLTLCADFASWWLARPFEPFIYVIAAAGAVFGLSYGLQILAVAYWMWLAPKAQAR
jgi:mono/diheme cytochrome c family protein